MKNGLFSALMSAVLIAPVTILAQDEPTLEHLVIEMASTAAEHGAVARYYTGKAEEARQEMRRHERMAQAYAGSRTSNPQRMRNHCQELVKNYEEIAAEYDELARLHEEEASNAPQ